MTSWNLFFDYAAILGYLMIFVWMANEAWIPMRTYQVYHLFVATALFATVFEVAATLLARNMDVVGFTLFYNVLTVQTLFINLVPILFAYYIILLANIGNSIWNRRLFFGAAALVDLAVLLLNPWMRWAFTFENERYMIAPVGLVLYAIDLLMLAISGIVLVRFRKNYQFIKPVPLVFMFICTIVACGLQIFLYLPALNLLIMTVSLTLYHYQHNGGLVTDSVTGAYNRKFMGEYIQNLFLDKKRFGVFLVAMDDFKFINKTYGVEVGDGLLQQISLYLKEKAFLKLVFRFSSDQFCAVLDKKVDCIDKMAEEFMARFHEPWHCNTKTDIMLSASLCYLECPKDAASLQELIEVLDYSLGEAKRLRKGQISKIGAADIEKAKKEKAIEMAVRTAMEEDRLLVFYQPIYSVEEKGYHSAEALVRLKDEKLGWISPEVFIPIAERAGLLLELGEMVLTKVCRFIRDSRLGETGIKFIEVNLSPVQLVQVQFAERAKQIMEQYGVKPSQIDFEITETFSINSIPSVMNNINKLIDYGVRFCLDDYGSGYANINYINSMPFSIIKIDKEMLWESFKNPKAAVTLEYTVAMINALKLSIVTEGVETEEMRSKLEEIGCHYLQGWYFSKAVPEEEFLKFITDHA